MSNNEYINFLQSSKLYQLQNNMKMNIYSSLNNNPNNPNNTYTTNSTYNTYNTFPSNITQQNLISFPNQLTNNFYNTNTSINTMTQPKNINNYNLFSNSHHQFSQFNQFTQFSQYFNYPYTYKNINININTQNQSQSSVNTNTTNTTNSYTTNKKTFPDTNTISEHSSERDKWLAARKRNYPKLENIEKNEKINKEKVSKGLLSKLELKLREKIVILNRIESRQQIKIEKNEFKRLNDIVENKKGSLSEKGIYNHQGNKEKSVLNKKRKKENKNENEIEEGEIEYEEKQVEECDERKENKENEIEYRKNKEINKKNKKNEKNERKAISFKYRPNNILKNLFKNEEDKEYKIILQAFWFFEEKGLLDD